ncbi:MAG: type IX secretion system sortase PorU [candidate division Zixibacteria bacterium]|nr:type IX secretion system sortase PorU [candidate division Zixibacteria bacterium]
MIKYVKYLMIFVIFSGFYSMCNAKDYEGIETGGVSILNSDGNGISFTYYPGQIYSEKVKTDKGDYDAVRIAEGYAIERNGYPALPAKNFYIALPPGSNPTVFINGSTGSKVINNLHSKPMGLTTTKSLPDKPINSLLYKQKERIRNLDVLLITISAVDYNPKSRNAVAYDRVNINVQFNSSESSTDRRISEDRFSQRIMRELLVNYEASRTWHYRPYGAVDMTPGTAFDSSQTWFKIPILDEGMYQLNYQTLINAGIRPDEVDPATVRLFGSEGQNLPTDNDDIYPMLTEIPVYISDGGDGSFDQEDYILFYALAANRFFYNTGEQKDIYRINSYTKYNYCYLTYGTNQFVSSPSRWQETDANVTNTSLPNINTFIDNIHVEENILLRRNIESKIVDYYNWFWTSGTQFILVTDEHLLNVVPNDTGWVYSSCYSGQATVKVNGETADNTNYANRITTSRTFNLQNGSNQLEFSYSSDVYFDYFEINYNRYLSVEGSKLFFRGTQHAGDYIYRLGNASQSNILLDITDPFHPVRLTGGNSDGNTWEFQYSTTGDHNRFYYVESSEYIIPTQIISYNYAGLRKTTNSSDIIVITYDGFRQQAERLASHRASYSNLTYYVADLSDVYDEFGWGRPDALSIRYFLKYAFENWSDPKPTGCLLIGDGHYDYMNYLGDFPTFIPPFQALSSGLFRSWASDDNYVFFGEYGYPDSDTSGFPDMVISRLPVKNNIQMEIIVDRIIDYDINTDIGQWKNVITVVADDQYGANLYNDDNEWFHTNQAEALCNDHVPGSFRINKIYGIAYALEEGRQKPVMEQAILNSFNGGSLIMDYIGHGNKNVWMHEHTFNKAEDLPRLTNRTKPTVMLAASCSIGFWDDPNDEGMAEELVRIANGGAIASIAATREVFAGPNTDLNNEIFDRLLYSNDFTISEAIYISKMARSSPTYENDRHYILFSDVGQKLAIPTLLVDIDSVMTGTSNDTLSALGLVTVKGSVKNRDGSNASDFNGIVYINAYDAVKKVSYGASGNSTYDLPGNTVFKGPAELTNGEFTANFLMPKDINYGENSAKIIAYVIDDNRVVDGSGYKDGLYLGRASGEVSDSTGPQISIYIDNQELNGSFMSVSPDFSLMAVITDSSGVNLTSQAGHFISLRIDDGETLDANVTENFEYDIGDYQTGSLDYSFSDLPLGEHKIDFKVWDNVNNSSLRTFVINVVTQDEIRLLDVMNYPNPFIDKTVIQYVLNRSDVNDVTIKVFTLSGLLIKTIRNCPSDNSYNFVEWNGRDDDGDEIANGVYIYKVMANGTGGKSESLQKALKLK